MKKILSFIVLFFIAISNLYAMGSYKEGNGSLFLNGKEIIKGIDDLEAGFTKDNGKFIYSYYNTLGDKKYYKVIDGKKYGPFNYDDWREGKASIYEEVNGENNGDNYSHWDYLNKLKHGKLIRKEEKQCREETEEELKSRTNLECMLNDNCSKDKKEICDYKEKFYLEVLGKEYGPFDNYISEYQSYIFDNNKFIFSYQKDNKFYVNINGKIYGPYDEINNLGVFNNKYYFLYKKNNKNYININGKTYGPYDKINNFEVKGDKGDKISFSYKKDNNFYQYYSGKIYGPYNCKNSFIFNYQNGKTIINCGENKFIINGNEILYNLDKEKGKFTIISNGKEVFNITNKEYVNGNLYCDYKNNGLICNLGFFSPTIGVGGATFVFTDKFLGITTQKQIKTNKSISNPKIDKLLNKFFAKIDKKGETKAKIIYKKVIQKIDTIISKTTNSKKKQLLEYIKTKFEEKLK